MKSEYFPFGFAISVAVISAVGLLDAFYLTLQHYVGFPAVCILESDCGSVLTSQYATIFSIPTALLGALYYAAMFFLALCAIETRQSAFFVIFSLFSILGLLVSVWFVYLQLVVLKAICSYCMVSAISSFVLFGLSVWFLRDRSSAHAS